MFLLCLHRLLKGFKHCARCALSCETSITCSTVVYQQIENSERANQIHRFTIDHCKFILISNMECELMYVRQRKHIVKTKPKEGKVHYKNFKNFRNHCAEVK